MLAALRPLLLAVPTLLVAPARGVAAAPGDYHDGTTLDCAECHVMHPTPPAAPRPLGVSVDEAARERVGRLLREDVNDLCLACHDGSRRATDVLGWNAGGDPGAVRLGGYLNRVGGPWPEATGHTLDSLAPAPGAEPAWRPELENGPGKGLNCINCHAHHGSPGEPTYRNLRSDAGHNAFGEGRVRYNHGQAGVNDLSRDVFVRRARDYDESAVDFNEPDPRGSAMDRFCAGCHGDFHGAPGTGAVGGARRAGGALGHFVRHPTAGVDLGATAGGDLHTDRVFASRGNRVKVMSPTGEWDPPGRGLTPTCVSCHKAHGNGNAFGLLFRSGSGRPTEDGDTGGTRLEHLCAQCHPATLE